MQRLAPPRHVAALAGWKVGPSVARRGVFRGTLNNSHKLFCQYPIQINTTNKKTRRTRTRRQRVTSGKAAAGVVWGVNNSCASSPGPRAHLCMSDSDWGPSRCDACLSGLEGLGVDVDGGRNKAARGDDMSVVDWLTGTHHRPATHTTSARTRTCPSPSPCRGRETCIKSMTHTQEAIRQTEKSDQSRRRLARCRVGCHAS